MDDTEGGGDERDDRESSPQPGKRLRLRGGKVTERKETGREETGRKGPGGKTMGTNETGGNHQERKIARRREGKVIC